MNDLKDFVKPKPKRFYDGRRADENLVIIAVTFCVGAMLGATIVIGLLAGAM